MPLYHYRCTACGHSFEQLVHTRDGVVVTAIRCPRCGGGEPDRQLTTFHVGGSAPASDEPFCGRCGENRPPCGN